MKTENIIATVKVEPLNYATATQSYGGENNIYAGAAAKKQRLERFVIRYFFLSDNEFFSLTIACISTF